MDVNAEAEKALQKCGYSVVFQYPQCFSKLPVVSFYTVREQGSVSFDNKEVYRDGTVAVDIWAKNPKTCCTAYGKVREAMLSDGWEEMFSSDVPRGSKDVYHRTAQFIKSFYISQD